MALEEGLQIALVDSAFNEFRDEREKKDRVVIGWVFSPKIGKTRECLYCEGERARRNRAVKEKKNWRGGNCEWAKGRSGVG